MKSQARVLLHVLKGLLLGDATSAYPELRGSFLKDYERIALYVQKRGLSVFTLDLPALDPILLQGLETGRLMPTGAFSMKVSKGIRVPRLFSGLWLRVFDTSSCLKLDPDTSAVAFLRQILRLGKNLEVECSPKRISSAIGDFLNVERVLRQPTLSWAGDSLCVGRVSNNLHLADCLSEPLSQQCVREPSLFDELPLTPCAQKVEFTPHNQHILENVQQVADILCDILGSPRPLMYSHDLEKEGQGIGFRHGPGAVAERLGNHQKSRFPNWTAKLERRFPFLMCGVTTLHDGHIPLNHEPPSRLISVPKTAKGPRLIAAEPVSHQWCQQILRHWISSRLVDEFGRPNKPTDFIDFRRQYLSGDMVLQASLNRKHATVDLSDASDRLTCWTVERIFRRLPSLLVLLHAARTRWMRSNIPHSPGFFIKLKKFATQGTATTFPIQSLVFLVIAISATIGDGKVTRQRIEKLRGQVRVFGDDIILPTHGYARLVHIMEMLQLKVNMTKSYVNGHFRESCGTDGFMGDDVTPVSPRCVVADGPASCQAVVDTTNNLFNKGYWHASNNLRSTIPPRIQRGLRIVGPLDAGFAGLTSFSGSDESHLVKRWNKRLHRYEGRVFSLSGKSSKRDRQDAFSVLDFFASVHDIRHPRIASVYGERRKVRSDFLWEPLNSGAHGYPRT